MKQKFMTIFLAFCMVFAFIPHIAFAASSDYVVIGNEELSASTPYFVNGEASDEGTLGENGCSAYFDAENSRLTLNGFDVVGEIFTSGDLEVILEGENNIEVTEPTSDVSGRWTVEAGGTLKTVVKDSGNQADSNAKLSVNAASTALTLLAVTDEDPFTVTFNGKTTGYTDFHKAWTAATSVSSSEDNRAIIKMNQDIMYKYSESVSNGKYITLDLNGHTLDWTDLQKRITVLSGGNFVLDDTSSDVLDEQGKITGGNYNSTGEGGGAISVEPDAVFTLNGGSLSGNKAYQRGGAVFIEGTFIMNGGSIRDNIAVEMWDAADGGGVCNYGNNWFDVDLGNFTMSGGKISGNTALSGGGIENSGQLIVNNAEISGNTALYGGGIYNWYNEDVSSDVTIKGSAVIKDNKAFADDGSGSGGGIFFEDGSLNIESGIITGNTSTCGGGVYLDGGAASFRDNAVITDNLCNETANNLFLGENATINIGSMGSNAKIGVTAEIEPVKGTPTAVSFNNDVTKADFSKFRSDNKAYCLQLYEGKVSLHVHACDQKVVSDEYLKTPADCTNKAVYYKSCGCGETGEETFEAGNPLGHKIVKVEAREASSTQNGNIEYWYCERCGKYFGDKELTQEITKEDTIIEAQESPDTGDEIPIMPIVILLAAVLMGSRSVYKRQNQ